MVGASQRRQERRRRLANVCAAVGLVLAAAAVLGAPGVGLDLSPGVVVVLWAVTLVSALFMALTAASEGAGDGQERTRAPDSSQAAWRRLLTVSARLGLLLAVAGIFIAPRMGFRLSAPAAVLLWVLLSVCSVFLALCGTHRNPENATGESRHTAPGELSGAAEAE